MTADHVWLQKRLARVCERKLGLETVIEDRSSYADVLVATPTGRWALEVQRVATDIAGRTAERLRRGVLPLWLLPESAPVRSDELFRYPCARIRVVDVRNPRSLVAFEPWVDPELSRRAWLQIGGTAMTRRSGEPDLRYTWLDADVFLQEVFTGARTHRSVTLATWSSPRTGWIRGDDLAEAEQESAAAVTHTTEAQDQSGRVAVAGMTADQPAEASAPDAAADATSAAAYPEPGHGDARSAESMPPTVDTWISPPGDAGMWRRLWRWVKRR